MGPDYISPHASRPTPRQRPGRQLETKEDHHERVFQHAGRAARPGPAILDQQICGFIAALLSSYVAWRLERAAIAQLQSMSDRELRDIGLNRSEIETAVKTEVALPSLAAPLHLSNHDTSNQPNHPAQGSDKMTTLTYRPETLVLHAGPRTDAATGAVAVPIVQTTSFQFRNTEHAANLFALKEFGNIYSRIMNPTCDALEQKMAALEGGVAALAVSSGQAASAMAIQNLCRPGDNVVSLDRSLWRHLESVRQHAAVHGHHGALRRSGRSGELPPRHRPPHARLLRRDAAQSEAHGVSDRRGRNDRPLRSACR